jgi:hypothetical protein
MTGWRVIATLAGICVCAPVAAQDYIPAPPRIDGEIGEADRLDGQGRRFDDFALELRRGEAIVVSADPASGSRLEPAIEISLAGVARPLARDAADAGSRAARLSFTASEAGVYHLRVLGHTAAAGRYILRLRRAQAGPPTRGFSIGLIGGGATPPPANPDPQDGGSTGTRSPLSRFIICPGHPRCPR